MTRGSGKERSDEISHAARAFSLLLAGGALARVMKLTAGGRGAFTFEGLDRSELLSRPSNEKARRDAPSFMTFAERRRFELLIPFRSIHAFQACLLSHSSISPITTLSAHETRKQDCKYTNYL